MNNIFLDELAQKPIVNTFKLAYKMLLSNKFLFAVVTMIFIFFSIIQFIIPLTITKELATLPMALIMSVMIGINIISQIFTESNYLYICKMLLTSQNEEACIDTMSYTKVSVVFTNYFTRASGSSLAFVLIALPLIMIRKELYISAYWDIFLMLLLVLVLYVYALVAHKITLSKNFKESFLATFSLFSPTVWKQSFNLLYAKFVISIMLLLSGMFFMLNYGIENVSYIDNKVIFIGMMMIITILSMFIALYVLPIAMMIAQRLSVESNGR